MVSDADGGSSDHYSLNQYMAACLVRSSLECRMESDVCMYCVDQFEVFL